MATCPLLSLPNELIDHVANFTEDDVLILRQVCRRLNEATMHRVGERFFSKRFVFLSLLSSLENLAAIAKHETFRNHVRALYMSPSFPDLQREESGQITCQTRWIGTDVVQEETFRKYRNEFEWLYDTGINRNVIIDVLNSCPNCTKLGLHHPDELGTQYQDKVLQLIYKVIGTTFDPEELVLFGLDMSDLMTDLHFPYETRMLRFVQHVLIESAAHITCLHLDNSGNSLLWYPMDDAGFIDLWDPEIISKFLISHKDTLRSLGLIFIRIWGSFLPCPELIHSEMGLEEIRLRIDEHYEKDADPEDWTWNKACTLLDDVHIKDNVKTSLADLIEMLEEHELELLEDETMSLYSTGS
ncbi:hypothetical protein NA57DRAFT_70340 [Rhizodiscina lignyota]|uniref:F-box domain-containing protein n=1 Tax=Rhizodiscina lignyota TaxID=1504668 RepID=A0A9P4MAL3_9PEZI|nr:hypothetical protein NA57DRAFT_70340 [Rhizodiscina lignyota]